MPNWIKNIFVMSPYKRLLIAFFLGAFQNTFWMNLMQDFAGKEAYILRLQEHWVNTHWAFWFALWVMILVLYVWNLRNFSKETLWMTIKNPAKVTITEDEVWGRQVHPVRPPPPPKPPVPHHKRTYTNGSAWPPKKP